MESITGIGNLVNLTELDLFNNDIEDISELSKLINLKKLNLSDNNIEDIKPLSNLINLEDLNIENCYVDDYSIFEKMNLDFLHLTIEDQYLYTVNLYIVGSLFFCCIYKYIDQDQDIYFLNYLTRQRYSSAKLRQIFTSIKIKLLWLDFFYLQKDNHQFNRFSYFGL